MTRKSPENSIKWIDYQASRQARYARLMKCYGPHPHWFAQRNISQKRSMRRMLLKGKAPIGRHFSSSRSYHVWKQKRRRAIEVRHRLSIRDLPYREQTRRIARLLRSLRVLW